MAGAAGCAARDAGDAEARANGRELGTTLIETLVALLVLSLIVALLGQGVDYGIRAVARTDREQTDLATVDRALRQAILSMDPGTYTEPPHLVARADALAFTADLPLAEAGAERPRADMALALSGGRLVLRSAPHLHAELFGSAIGNEESVLAEHVARLELAFAGRDGVWTGNWTAQDLPALVRITVGFGPGDRRHWPPIIAATARERAEE